MLMDHLAYFFPNIFPGIFHWVGRLAAPLFIFCLVQGILHTSNRINYLKRIYFFSIIMCLGNDILNAKLEPNIPIMSNIFTTLLLIAIIITILEAHISTLQKVVFVTLYIVWQFLILFIGNYIITTIGLNDPMNVYIGLSTIGTLFPCIFYAEGELILVVLGIILYLFRRNKRAFITAYVFFCLLFIVVPFLEGNRGIELINDEYQWMMILALPIMLRYNGKRGFGLKYFYYIIYPVHIWLFCLMSSL